MREWGEESQPPGCVAFALCVCLSHAECVCVCVQGGREGGGMPTLLITERLYVNPKASVVVNLGEEAILNILLCSTQLSKWNKMMMLIMADSEGQIARSELFWSI